MSPYQTGLLKSIYLSSLFQQRERPCRWLPLESPPPQAGFLKPKGQSKHNPLGILSNCAGWAIQLQTRQTDMTFSWCSSVQGKSSCHLDQLSTELGLQLSSVTFHGVEGNTSLCLGSSWIELRALGANRQMVTREGLIDSYPASFVHWETVFKNKRSFSKLQSEKWASKPKKDVRLSSLYIEMIISLDWSRGFCILIRDSEEPFEFHSGLGTWTA